MKRTIARTLTIQLLGIFMAGSAYAADQKPNIVVI
jgi:hypothetical protein